MQQTGQHAHPCRLKITASQVRRVYVYGADVFVIITYLLIPGRVAQSVATEACLAVDQRFNEFDPGLVPYFRDEIN